MIWEGGNGDIVRIEKVDLYMYNCIMVGYIWEFPAEMS